MEMIFQHLDHDEYLVAEALLDKKRIKADRSAADAGFFTCLSGYQPVDSKKSLFCLGSD